MWNKEFYLHFVSHLGPHHELGHNRDVNEDNQHSGVGTSLNSVILVRLKSLRECDIFCLCVCCEVLAQSLFNMESRKPSSAAGLVSGSILLLY